MAWKRMSLGGPLHLGWFMFIVKCSTDAAIDKTDEVSLPHTHTQMIIYPYSSVSQHHAGVGPLTTRGRLIQRTHTCQNSYRTFSRANLDVGTGGRGFQREAYLTYTVKPNMTHHPLQCSPDTERRSKSQAFLWLGSHRMKNSSKITFVQQWEEKCAVLDVAKCFNCVVRDLWEKNVHFM